MSALFERGGTHRAGISRRLSPRCSRSLVLLLGVAGIALAPVARAQQSTVTAPSGQRVLDNVAPHPAPEQPLPYSHKTHLALGLVCTSCHTEPAGGAQMGFPPTSTCMSCHTAVAADQPTIMKLAEYARSGETIPWVRVYKVLPGVTWSHQPHLAAGIDCAACHGDVASLEQMAMTTSVVAMGSCVGCHQDAGASTVCYTCHAWPTPPTAAADRPAAR